VGLLLFNQSFEHIQPPAFEPTPAAHLFFPKFLHVFGKGWVAVFLPVTLMQLIFFTAHVRHVGSAGCHLTFVEQPTAF
jgi:hypothetical protein